MSYHEYAGPPVLDASVFPQRPGDTVKARSLSELVFPPGYDTEQREAFRTILTQAPDLGAFAVDRTDIVGNPYLDPEYIKSGLPVDENQAPTKAEERVAHARMERNERTWDAERIARDLEAHLDALRDQGLDAVIVHPPGFLPYIEVGGKPI